MIRVHNPRLLNLTVYLIVIIMVSLGLLTLPGGASKVAAISLCVAFGLVHGFGFRLADTPGRLSLYFVVQVIIILALLRLTAPGDLFNFFFYILGIEAVMLLPGRPALAWIVGFYLLDSLSALVNNNGRGTVGILFYAGAFVLTGVFGYVLRQSEIARRKNQYLLEELEKSQRQLQELAVTEERNRTARELHDSLGHRLTVTIVQLEGAQRLILTDPERAARMIGTLRDEMKEAIAELRHTVSALRAPVPSELRLDRALSTLSRTFEANTGIPTHFSVSPDFPGLPETHRLAFYRAAQEGLTNIQRHATARNAWVNLSTDDRKIILVIEDDGKGMADQAPNSASSGLRGLRERAGLLGGAIHLGERPGGGVQLVFSVPLPTQG